MAYWKAESWVTSVVNNESVAGALVLAKSLRRTKTTRRIATITSSNVSFENRSKLLQNFDFVFLLDEIYAPGGISTDDQGETQAKAYCFALIFFEKCVYLPANSMVVENLDKLFEGNYDFQCRIHPKDGSLDLSFFVLKPARHIWEKIWESVNWGRNKLTEHVLSSWLKNQEAALKLGSLAENLIGDFLVSTGWLKSDRTYTPIIRFEGCNNNQASIYDQLKLLKGRNVGMHERLITSMWLDTFHDALVLPPRDTTNAPKPNNDNSDTYKRDPIAIVGMSCRFPGAKSLKEFWDLLHDGEEGIREPPAFRWTKEHSIKVTSLDRKTQAGFLTVPVDEFDARFFGVSPKEAVYMDPQTRLLHEVLWEALEDAGIDPLSLYGSHTGIFTGSWMNDYKDIVTGSAEKDFFRTYMGNSIGAAAARLSFLLGLTGPSIATESGCSSAIVALDLAVKSLRNGETNLALAGGVNLLLHPFTSDIIEYVISPNGRCKTFDASADGFGRAEGCGVVVLKRLSDALKDRDNIWAVVRGSAVSQEGLTRSLGTPTVHCEALSMKLALEDANVTPEQVSFVETHGTGTQVGDPMEVAAIQKAYYTPKRKEPLVIGSVKTNVGHTESCSGITGIMKAVLALQHELIPKHLNLETLNSEIFLDSIPAIIPTENWPWPKIQGQPRICGVSSFGITGTDGHVILEESPDYELPKFNLGLERPTHLMTISGKTGEALSELLEEYKNRFLERKENETFADLAYSANVGRAGFNHRAILIASNFEDAGEILKKKRLIHGEIKERTNTQICFLFTGQGSQYPGMAKLLYDTSPVFRVNFDACDRFLSEGYQVNIRKVLWDSDPDSEELCRTIYSQTSIFCVEYCLLRLWESWGFKPNYVLGHSLGEFCAAVAAEVLNFEDALKLVAERSRFIDNLPQGRMLVVKASKPEVEKWMKAAKIDLDFAAVNNPEQTVVAGNIETVEAFLSILKAQGTKAVILQATHAFHSRHMDPMLESYRKLAQQIQYKKGNANIQYVSSVEGRIIEDLSEIGPEYWIRHTREKVSFIDACAAVKESGCQDFLEVGPQPILCSFVMQNIEDIPLNCFSSLRRGTNDWETILTSLGKLYLLGYQVDWKGYDDPYPRKKVSLPFHPFQRKSYWVECTSNNAPIIHPFLGSQINNASALNIFQQDLLLKNVNWLKDHCIGNRIVFPGAGYAEMCLSAGYCVANGLTECLEPVGRAVRLENLRVDAPLELKEEKVCRLQTIVDLPETNSENPGFRVKIYHQNTVSSEELGKWVLHASSTFIPVANTKDCMKLWNPQRIPELLKETEPITSELFYKRVDEAGLTYGENFRMLKRFWAVPQKNSKTECDEILAEMELPSDWNKYLLHPIIIDAVFQTGILTRYRYIQSQKLRVPVRIGGLTLFPGMEGDKTSGNLVYLHTWKVDERQVLLVTTPEKTPLAWVEDVELLDTTVATIESVLELQSSALPDSWEEVWKTIPCAFNTQVDLDHESCTTVEFQQKIKAIGHNTPLDIENFQKNKRLILLYIVNACQQLGWKPEVGQEVDITGFCNELGILPGFSKLVRFYFSVFQEDDGLLEYLGRVEGGKEEEKWRVRSVPPENEQVVKEMDELTSELKKAEDYADVTVIHENIGKNLSQILLGQQSALTILFPTDEKDHQYSADAYYRVHPSRTKLIDLMDVVISSVLEDVKRSNLDGKGVYRVLEVGAGTGSLSGALLKVCQQCCGDQFELYYTDISQAFFVKAEQKFEEFRENIKFEVFNIEQSPLSQGIPLGYFDLVCATDVLHATRDLEETLVHLRQTMRPGGVLAFTETVVPARDITFLFGLLEGYWRYEDFERRPYHCCVGDEVWEPVMRKSGFKDFTSYKVCVDQFALLKVVADDKVRMDTLIPPKIKIGVESPCWVVFADGENIETVSRVANTLVASGNRVVLARRPSAAKLSRKFLVNAVSTKVVEVEEEGAGQLVGLLGDEHVQGVIYCWGMDQKEVDQRNVALPFLQLVKLLVAQPKPPKLYVITEGLHAVTEDTITTNPTAATLFGMGKSLKNECFDMFVRCVDLEVGRSAEELAAQVLYEIALSKGFKEQNRVQVAYRGNVRYEPRMGKCQMQKKSDDLKLPPSTDRYHLVLPESKMIQDLEFAPMEVEPVGDSEIEVKVKSYALNFRDIFAIMKPSQEFEKLNGVGLDFSGVVTRAGPEAKWKVGQRVFGYNPKDEQLPSHLIVDSKFVTGIPEQMTYWEAATLPAVFCTAYHCLITVAQMKKGDRVLIHTASGGVGLAAIQLAKMVGAEIITTAGNPRKRAYLKSLGVQHVFHSRDTSYEQDILRVTNRKGVDIVLNSITGPGIKEATLRVTAFKGRFVEMSKLTVWIPDEVKRIRPDVEYSIVDLTTVDEDIRTNLLAQMQKLLCSRQLNAIPFVKFDALRIRQALQYFQKARHIGKVVVTMPEVSTHEGQFKTEVPLFNGESTYLITGGLGGIGFEVCKWMFGLGATDIVLTGRRAPAPEIEEQINSLRDSGFNVRVMLGDIGSVEHCRSLVSTITMEMKPLRGVMHCAGVLRDNLYPNQTWESFQATFIPKVQGSWNLHEVTKNLLLEHFVVYSSATALIGTPGQANHAAANCFEDAFIHYRHSLGFPGLTINWGQWAQVGCAKEIKVLSLLPVSVQRMLNGMYAALRTEKRQLSFIEFTSLKNALAMCPMIKFYMEERVFKQYNSGQAQSGPDLKADKFWEEIDQAATKAEKIDVLSGYLKTILRSALRLDPDEKLSETADLQELGVDSLMMIELKNSIQSLLGSRLTVTANMLKNCNTIQLISGAVVGKILEEEGEEEDVPLEPLDSADLLELLKKDTQLPVEVQVTPETEPAAKIQEIKSVLVTGATGQVGPYVIAEICKKYPNVEKVVCLVRGAEDDDTALEKLKVQMKGLDLQDEIDWDKIEVVVGNIVLENMGIEKERYVELSKSVEGIVHLAAKTNVAEHLRPPLENGKRTDCRSVNILGTLNILRFACTGKVKHVFYSSTILSGIFSEIEDSRLTDDWPESNVIQNAASGRYPGLQTSKWVCEILLKQANQRGIPCKVFRLPLVAGHSKTGHVDVMKNTYILRFLGFLKLGAMPDIVVPAVGLPVDTCAEIALRLFMDENTPNEIFNVAHPHPQVEQEFAQMVKQEFNKTVDILEWKQFTERIEEAVSQSEEGLKDVYRNLKMISSHFADAAGFVARYTVASDTYFTNDKVTRFIPGFGSNLEPTMDTLTKSLKFVRDRGLLEEFGIK